MHAPAAVEFLGGPLDGDRTHAVTDELLKPVRGPLLLLGVNPPNPPINVIGGRWPHHRYVRVRRRDGDQYRYVGIVEA